MCDILFFIIYSLWIYNTTRFDLPCLGNKAAQARLSNPNHFSQSLLRSMAQQQQKRRRRRIACNYVKMKIQRFREEKNHHTPLRFKIKWEKSGIARILTLLLLARKIHLKRRLCTRSRQVMHLFHVLCYVCGFSYILRAAFGSICGCECMGFFRFEFG